MHARDATPGTILHYHATHDKNAYGTILVIGNCCKTIPKKIIALVIDSPFGRQEWPITRGHTYEWSSMEDGDSPTYHRAILCETFW